MIVVFVVFCPVSAQEEPAKKEESFEVELCKDKDAGEWFRLVAGEGDNCRDVIQCTSSGLQAIRCPAGLFFDIEKQTCDWKGAVKNCKLKNKERKVKPLLYTDEPLCQVSDENSFIYLFIYFSKIRKSREKFSKNKRAMGKVIYQDFQKYNHNFGIF